MRIDRQALQNMRKPIEDALKELGEELGVQFKLGNGSYNYSNGSFKLEISPVTEDGTVQTQERTDFARYCRRYGLQPTDIDREFAGNGRRLRICGIKPKSSRYPILAEELGTGKVFKYTSDFVVRQLRLEDSQREYDESGPTKAPEGFRLFSGDDGPELTQVDPPASGGFSLQTNRK